MIIVSQDEATQANYDNIQFLDIDIVENNAVIYAQFSSKIFKVLGTYQTKERAKEILDDITNTRAIFEIYKCSDADTQDIFDKKMLKENIIFDTYNMPKD